MRRSLPIMLMTLALAGCPPPETELTPDVDPGMVGVGELDPRTAGPVEHITYTPDEVQWLPGPESLPEGSEVAVLESTFHLGTGPEFDAGATRALPAGSFTVMPPGTEHFAHVEERTVIQLTRMGPWEIHYIDLADDPRS